jgi:hypothetical protein
MLRSRSAARLAGRFGLFIRVHILSVLRRDGVAGDLPELRWRTRGATVPAAEFDAAVSRDSATRAEGRWMPGCGHDHRKARSSAGHRVQRNGNATRSTSPHARQPSVLAWRLRASFAKPRCTRIATGTPPGLRADRWRLARLEKAFKTWLDPNNFDANGRQHRRLSARTQ